MRGPFSTMEILWEELQYENISFHFILFGRFANTLQYPSGFPEHRFDHVWYRFPEGTVYNVRIFSNIDFYLFYFYTTFQK